MFGQNPGNAAADTVSQIPGAISGYYSPYQQAGSQALNALGQQYQALLGMRPELQNQYTTLMTNPNAMMSSIGSGYEASPGYEWQLEQGTNAINNAEAAGGMLGTPEHQQESAKLATGLANQNFWDYMDRTIGLYNTGLSGSSNLYSQGLQGTQGINQMGYQANNAMAEATAQAMMAQAAAEARAAQNQRSVLGNTLGTAMNAGLLYATGGMSGLAKAGMGML